jgi:hypothetical protein
MLAWRSGDVSGNTTDWFNWKAKYVYLISILRNHAPDFDLACAGLLALLGLLGLFGIGFRMNRTLGVAALMLIISYILLPRILMGSAYADMRLAPFMVAIAVLALTPRARNIWWLNTLAVAALALFLVRIGISTTQFIRLDQNYDRQLAALDHVPHGARVFVLVDLPCLSRWDPTRMDHLGAMAIVRREAFVNGQWSMPGAQLLSIQIMRPKRCRARSARSIEGSIAGFPRHAFDYLWLVDAPPAHWPNQPDLKQVWHGRTGALYRVIGSATAANDTPKGSERRVTQ